MINKTMSILIIFMLLMTIPGCLSSGISFIRENNLGYATETRGDFLCGKKVIQDWIERAEPEYDNIYTVFYLTKEKYWHAIIMAFDKDKDKYYEDIWFDTNNDGDFDRRLQGGHLNTNEIKQLYTELVCVRYN